MKSTVNQEKIIHSKDNLLVIASAGCGKTSTIVNKINYLLNNIKPEDILVVSFTNATVNDLKNKLNNNIHIFTFHKLAIYLLENTDYKLISDHYLKYVINEYFISIISLEDKNKLKYYFLVFNYNNLFNNKNFLEFKNTIYSFIKHMQVNNYDFNFLKDKYITSKDKFLFSIIMKIYYLYVSDKESENVYDLDDLIIKATNNIKNKIFNYKYIFVDEFQDTSYIRFNLIYTIFKNSNSIINLFGDDYQAIYSFSGCNVDIMLNIKKYIPNIKLITLDINFRSDNKLIQASNLFIQKNNNQLYKKVISNKYILNSINYIYYNNLNKSIDKIASNLDIDKILILSRFKHDLKPFNNKYNTMTIHEAKGLENDYIFIINFKNNYYGFPPKIKNDRLLNVFNINTYYEERRLFYVALTRATKKVYLFIPRGNKSNFIKEIKKIEKSI